MNIRHISKNTGHRAFWALIAGTAMSASVRSQDALSIERAVKLEFPMAEGNLYQIQDSADLGSWSDSGPAVVGENCMETVMQSIQNTDRRFWRIIPGTSNNVLNFGEARSLSSTNFISFENVLWHGKHWLIDYRIGNVLHQDEMKELNTVQIPTASITIDGDPADWTRVPTVYTDPQHDQNPPDGHQGTDIKEYRIARDATYIYMAFWLYDANPLLDRHEPRNFNSNNDALTRRQGLTDKYENRS